MENLWNFYESVNGFFLMEDSVEQMYDNEQMFGRIFYKKIYRIIIAQRGKFVNNIFVEFL